MVPEAGRTRLSVPRVRGVARPNAGAANEVRGVWCHVRQVHDVGWPARMSIRINGIVIDANDLESLAAFWSRLLGLAVTRREPDWVSLGPYLALQRVPEPKTAKNRVHLDVVADDFTAATAQAAALGAVPVGAVEEDLWQVWPDPEGNEFCICRS